MDVARRTLPEGVTLDVREHTKEAYEARFIPDPFIEGLKKELREYDERRRQEIIDKMDKKDAKDAAKRERLLAALDEDQDEDDEDEDDY